MHGSYIPESAGSSPVAITMPVWPNSKGIRLIFGRMQVRILSLAPLPLWCSSKHARLSISRLGCKSRHRHQWNWSLTYQWRDGCWPTLISLQFQKWNKKIENIQEGFFLDPQSQKKLLSKMICFWKSIGMIGTITGMACEGMMIIQKLITRS